MSELQNLPPESHYYKIRGLSYTLDFSDELCMLRSCVKTCIDILPHTGIKETRQRAMIRESIKYVSDACRILQHVPQIVTEQQLLEECIGVNRKDEAVGEHYAIVDPYADTDCNDLTLLALLHDWWNRHRQYLPNGPLAAVRIGPGMSQAFSYDAFRNIENEPRVDLSVAEVLRAMEYSVNQDEWDRKYKKNETPTRPELAAALEIINKRADQAQQAALPPLPRRKLWDIGERAKYIVSDRLKQLAKLGDSVSCIEEFGLLRRYARESVLIYDEAINTRNYELILASMADLQQAMLDVVVIGALAAKILGPLHNAMLFYHTERFLQYYCNDERFADEQHGNMHRKYWEAFEIEFRRLFNPKDRIEHWPTIISGQANPEVYKGFEDKKDYDWRINQSKR